MLSNPEAPPRLPRRQRGFGLSGDRRSTVIRVSITYGDLMVEADFESDFYSGDVVEDMTTRTCSALLATLQHLWAMQP